VEALVFAGAFAQDAGESTGDLGKPGPPLLDAMIALGACNRCATSRNSAGARQPHEAVIKDTAACGKPITFAS
jgi:hypothetical protein